MIRYTKAAELKGLDKVPAIVRVGDETSEKIKYHLFDRYEIIDRSLKKYKDMSDVLKNSLIMKKEATIR